MDPNERRICYLVDGDWQTRSSGVYTFSRQVIPHWRDLYDLSLVSFPVAPPAPCSQGPIEKKQTRRRSVNGWALAFGYLKMLMAELRKVSSVRKQLKDGIIVLNEFGCEWLPVACRILFPFASIVSISHTHPHVGKDFLVRRIVEQLCYWSCSRVVFNSYALKQIWEQKLGRKVHKGVVVHHGIALPETWDAPAAYPEKLPRVLDVVCAGLFYRWKGQLALIEAWPEILEQCEIPLRLIFVGGGVCLEEAKARVKELGLEQNVVFLGQQENGAEFFNGADIAIHYPVEPEAFGLVLLEAMGRGKPVIAPAHGGAMEIVLDGETGFLVAPDTAQTEDGRLKTEDLLVGSAGDSHPDLLRVGKHREAQRSLESDVQGLQSSVFSLQSDSPSLQSAICRLAEDADLRKRMGTAGRERVRMAFSVEKMLEGYDRVFREMEGI